MPESKLAGQSILSSNQFSFEELDIIFRVASRMRDIHERCGCTDLLRDKLIATLFFQPSTRTELSFVAATMRLGGHVSQIENVETFSSMAKGENLEDTILTISQYFDAIVMRHKEKGSVARAANAATVPVINAGDGVGEHPTQALLDCYTIRREMLGEGARRWQDLRVVMIGDLLNGRTIHSLTRLLARYETKLGFFSPKSLVLPVDMREKLDSDGADMIFYDTLHDALADADVFYVTRIQQEYFEDLNEYEELAGSYIITPEVMQSAKQDMILMHPFPRVSQFPERCEISIEVDRDPRAAYFRQIRNGLYVRMALLALVLGKASQ